jgi:class 3 adenylate cyclase
LAALNRMPFGRARPEYFPATPRVGPGRRGDGVIGSLETVEVLPQIRFVTTTDGVAIAHWEVGSGRPLVVAQSLSLSHAELKWGIPSMASLYRELARFVRVVRFDPRSSGLSDDPQGIPSLESFGRDVGAVADALGLDTFDLMGAVALGPAMVKYAVDHPARVGRLLLCDTGPTLADLPLAKFARAGAATAGLEVLPSFGVVAATEDLRAIESLMRGSRFGRPSSGTTFLDHDVAGILTDVSAPTLVIRSQDSVFTDQEQTRRLVSGIPQAQLRLVPGTMAPYLADRDAMTEAIVTFVDPAREVTSRVADAGLRTIVFTDLVSSTEALERLGDADGRARVREVERLVSELSAQYGGRLVKHLGDGSLLSFNSTSGALRFAAGLQQRGGDAMRSGLRVGMAAGEPIEEDGDVHGAVVVQASRIADLAGPGEIAVADAVRQLAMGKGFAFAPIGEVQLKGFDEETHVWRLAASP